MRLGWHCLARQSLCGDGRHLLVLYVIRVNEKSFGWKALALGNLSNVCCTVRY